MSDETTKTYVFGQDNNSLLSMLAPLCHQKGIDPNILLAMKDKNSFGEGGFLWVIFLFFLMGWGGYGNGFGFGGRNGEGLANQINNDYGRDLLLQAINGNGNALNQLATTLNCDINAVQNAINAVNNNVSSVGNQVGMTGQQIVNSIQSGNQQIAAQLAQCCCNAQQSILKMGYDNQIATLNQTNQLSGKVDSNTSQVTNAIANQTALLNDKFCQLEMRDMQTKINQLQEEKSILQNHISNSNQTSQIQSYIASVVNPIAQEVNAIKCAQPNTVTVPYQPFVTVPNCAAYQLGLVNGNQNLWF